MINQSRPVYNSPIGRRGALRPLMTRGDFQGSSAITAANCWRPPIHSQIIPYLASGAIAIPGPQPFDRLLKFPCREKTFPSTSCAEALRLHLDSNIRLSQSAPVPMCAFSEDTQFLLRVEASHAATRKARIGRRKQIGTAAYLRRKQTGTAAYLEKTNRDSRLEKTNRENK